MLNQMVIGEICVGGKYLMVWWWSMRVLMSVIVFFLTMKKVKMEREEAEYQGNVWKLWRLWYFSGCCLCFAIRLATLVVAV